MSHAPKYPKTEWGIYERPHETHVVPCDRLGRMAIGHILKRDCRCKPRVEPSNGRPNPLPVVIHDRFIAEASNVAH
jgi:hypothetical protein